MDLKIELSQNLKSELSSLITDLVKTELKPLLEHFQGQEEANDDFLSRKETATLLGCSMTTLYHYQVKELIPYYKVGRKILFKKSDLLTHIKVKAEKPRTR